MPILSGWTYYICSPITLVNIDDSGFVIFFIFLPVEFISISSRGKQPTACIESHILYNTTVIISDRIRETRRDGLRRATRRLARAEVKGLYDSSRRRFRSILRRDAPGKLLPRLNCRSATRSATGDPFFIYETEYSRCTDSQADA